MARRRYEKPRKGNPLQLPVKQHVFPVRSIERFVNDRGVVQLHRLEAQHTHAASPDDPMFCAMRVWDWRAERGFMKQIEDEFQGLAASIIAGTVTTIVGPDKAKVDRFYALWKWRADFRNADPEEIQFNNVTGAKWTQEQEEQFEKAGVLFLREGGKMPAHRVHGGSIQVAIDREMSVLSTIEWGIIQTLGGQFVVPDHPPGYYIPLLPTLCLLGGDQRRMPGSAITQQNMVELNRSIMSGCRAYYFANDLAACV